MIHEAVYEFNPLQLVFFKCKTETKEQRRVITSFLLLPARPNHIPVTCSHAGSAAGEGSGRRGGPSRPASRLGRGAEQPESRHQREGGRLLLL